MSRVEWLPWGGILAFNYFGNEEAPCHQKGKLQFPHSLSVPVDNQASEVFSSSCCLSPGPTEVTSIIDAQDSENINPGCCLPTRWSLLPQLIEGSFP